jgi:hypothetical protein
MRRLVAALIIAGMALAIAGCGGDTGAVVPTGIPTSTAPPASSNTAKPDDKLAPTITVAPGQVAYPEPWPLPPFRTPRKVQDALDSKQPLMLVYIDSSQRVTADQKAEISAVAKDYAGAIDVVIYDIAKGLPEARNTLGSETATAVAAGQILSIDHTPYILFINDHGNITWRFDGYTDRKLLEREILRATAE